jgi:hypothetical protein
MTLAYFATKTKKLELSGIEPFGNIVAFLEVLTLRFPRYFKVFK